VQHRLGDAIDACEKALELVPEHHNARANLAYCLVAAPDPERRDPERALELATWVLRRTPKALTAWNTYSIALFRAGHYQRAVRALDRTAELGGGYTVYRLYVLAMAHWSLGQEADAIENFQEAEKNRGLEPADDRTLEAVRAEAAAMLGVRLQQAGKGEK
jgi:tetratricopeptide (TPR) repeat protein